jgi:hypothetical protein
LIKFLFLFFEKGGKSSGRAERFEYFSGVDIHRIDLDTNGQFVEMTIQDVAPLGTQLDIPEMLLFGL